MLALYHVLTRTSLSIDHFFLSFSPPPSTMFRYFCIKESVPNTSDRATMITNTISLIYIIRWILSTASDGSIFSPIWLLFHNDVLYILYASCATGWATIEKYLGHSDKEIFDINTMKYTKFIIILWWTTITPYSFFTWKLYWKM